MADAKLYSDVEFQPCPVSPERSAAPFDEKEQAGGLLSPPDTCGDHTCCPRPSAGVNGRPTETRATLRPRLRQRGQHGARLSPPGMATGGRVGAGHGHAEPPALLRLLLKMQLAEGLHPSRPEGADVVLSPRR